MRRARSVTGPLRRAHPASGATWNVQVVRGKMSSQCLWHACRALSAGLLLMLLGAAMAVIGYYADFLSVDQEIRGNATVSVKDEARGFHLNNLSYVGPIVMGFGGFIVVAACVMTFEARDSAAKVTPARPTALPRPLPRRGPPCAPARLDQLGVYRLPHVLPLPHSLPLVPMHRHRPVQVSASAVDSECGSQSSLALDLHASGACAGVTLRVRDNTRRRPLARQQRLRDDTLLITPKGSTSNINNEEAAKTPVEDLNSKIDTTRLSVESELRASSAPPLTRPSNPSSLPSPTLPVVTPLESQHTDSCITINLTVQQLEKPTKHEMEKQTDALRGKIEEEIAVLPREVVLDMDLDELVALNENRERMAEEEIERQIELQIMVAMAQEEDGQTDDEDGVDANNAQAEEADRRDESNTGNEEDNARALERHFSEVVEVTGYPSMFDLNTRDEFSLERLQEELDIDIISRLAYRYEYHTDRNTYNMHTEQEAERQFEEAMGGYYENEQEEELEESIRRRYEEASERRLEEVSEKQFEEVIRRQYVELTQTQSEEVLLEDMSKEQCEEAINTQSEKIKMIPSEETTERESEEVTDKQSEEATEEQYEQITKTQSEQDTKRPSEEATEGQSEKTV